MRAFPEAMERWRRRRNALVRQTWRPKPKLDLPQWSEAYRRFAGGQSEEGPWRNNRVPQLVEIMAAVSDPYVERIVVMKPARVGYTEGVIVNGVGYFSHQDPSYILVVQPTKDDAQKFSKEKLAPTIDATEVLRDLYPEPRSRDADNTILDKAFRGGRVGIVGTNSPRMLRMRDARVVFCDEVDAYPANSGGEGDPVALAFKRADNFANRKLIQGSSPKLKGSSRIELAYSLSDQRKWWVRCPHCGEAQLLEWGGRDTSYGIKWAKGKPDTAFYLCRHNACEILERDKPEANRLAEWRPDNPGHATRGYWFNALSSLLPGARWGKLVAEWIDAQEKPELLQVFVNTVLAETYELRNEKVDDADSLLGRREVYAAEVPVGVGVLVAMVDVQNDRLELLVRGFGAGQESWRIAHVVLEGDPDGDDVWAQLDTWIFREWQHEAGGKMRIRCTFVDSGAKTAAVYAYVKPRQRRGVYASKGDKQTPTAPIIKRGRKPNDSGVKLSIIGTLTAKRRMFSRLKQRKAGPGTMHFHRLPDTADRVERELFEAQDARYMAQFGNEVLTPVKDRRGNEVWQYTQVGPNEAVDLEVGALGALHALGASVYERLDREVARMAARGERARAAGDDGNDGSDDDTGTPGGDGAPRRPTPNRPPPRRSRFVFGF